MLETALFDYDLPDEFIARYPAEKRDGSRMMALERDSGETAIRNFPELVDYLEPGDAVICNNTKVRLGRLFGRKGEDGSGARFEALLLEPDAQNTGCWRAMLRPGKRAKAGTFVRLLEHDGSVNTRGDGFIVRETVGDGTYRIEFSPPDPDELQTRYGHIPLPPYLNRDAESADLERYQTVYAKCIGAVAAPTAGLHFTPEVFSALEAKGVKRGELTLHVGAGTFLPVSTADASQHKMHFEEYELPEKTAELVNSTHAAGHRVVAVGTTTVRVLESCVDDSGAVHAGRGRTDIFLYPPYRPRAVDMLLTNFHLPKSTLLMLVSCFCDREKVLAAYETAKRANMRFYSYGDCMLLYRRRR
jgi:S-adenosylmethionine:tRNA ribosyltransferase-isomerase